MARISDIRVLKVPPRWLFVRVTTEDGRVGWGEAIIPKRARAVIGAVADMAANLVGKDAGQIENIIQQLRRGAFFRGGPILSTAAAGIEIALWDIKGKTFDAPVHEFLGGAVRETIRSYAWIGGDSPHDVVAHAKSRIEQGFSAVKMNATPAMPYLADTAVIDDLVARMGALRDAYGKSLDIALDFHGRIHRSALKPLFREIEQFGPMWVEEATTPQSEEALVALARAAGSIPVATGERLNSRWEFKRVLDTGAIDIIQPDVSITGLFELEKIARLAEVYDVAVAPHCPNGPISLAASLQVGACCPNVVIQEQSLGLHYHQGYAGLPTADLLDYLEDRTVLSVTDGAFAVPSGRGLGLELDGGRIATLQQDWHLPDSDWRHADGTYAEW